MLLRGQARIPRGEAPALHQLFGFSPLTRTAFDINNQIWRVTRMVRGVFRGSATHPFQQVECQSSPILGVGPLLMPTSPHVE